MSFTEGFNSADRWLRGFQETKEVDDKWLRGFTSPLVERVLAIPTPTTTTTTTPTPTPKAKVVSGTVNPLTKRKGTKAYRNYNPGNITGMSGKLLYGAIGFAKSNTGDAGDRMQLVFPSEEAGFKAMHQLALDRYSGGAIKTEFAKWQTDKKAFLSKLSALKRAGIDINKRYSDLSPKEQRKFRKIWAMFEGYKGKDANYL